MMAAKPKNEEGAKQVLTGMAKPAAIDAYIAIDPAVVAANSEADTSGYNALQQKSVEAVGSAKSIAQFLDRDTDPDFAANVDGTGDRRLHHRSVDHRLDLRRRRGQEEHVHVRVNTRADGELGFRA